MPYAGAYAQAYYLATNQKPAEYRPTKAEAEQISKHNRTYTKRSMTEIFVERMFRKPRKGEQGTMMTMGDILQKLSFCRLPDLNETNVGNALREMGITKQRTKKGYRYYVTEVAPQIIEEESRQMGEEEFKRLEEESANGLSLELE